MGNGLIPRLTIPLDAMQGVQTGLLKITGLGYVSAIKHPFLQKLMRMFKASWLQLGMVDSKTRTSS